MKPTKLGLRLFCLQHCRAKCSLIRIFINFIVVLLCGSFLIAQLYHHKSHQALQVMKVSPKTTKKVLFERRPIVLPVLKSEEFKYIEPENSYFKIKFNATRRKIDWHDWDFIEQERLRRGPGENGDGYELETQQQINKNEDLLKVNGYYAVVSDVISVNRSVKDIRHRLCRKKKYIEHLPTASVVIPFFNDHLSVLMRTVHSVINRAPAHLLKEVILVNDRSTKEELYGELEKYLANNFEGKAHVVHLPERSGLIVARNTGAYVATGDVLIFLDSHTEANTNWLPPLLDPIAKDYRTCVCPYIDVIDDKTFHYSAQDEGARGAFEWNFLYKRLPLRKGDQSDPAEPFESPVMAGGLFAISTKFFWELGGYDPGLDIWGGEQYELSFKIWLCHGKMYDAPCSRIGHIYKDNPFPDPRDGEDYVSKNFKRVAEVWMDEYKEYLYKRNPSRYQKVDTGDISAQLAIKKKLQCKPFKYFLEVVAPDMLEMYPPVQIEFASGDIESIAFPNRCIDSMGAFYQPLELYGCEPDRSEPTYHQHFFLGHNRDIVFVSDSAYCISETKGAVELFACHHEQTNQYFRYDLDTQQIKVGVTEKKCLEAVGEYGKIAVNKCNSEEEKQKWRWWRTNEENLRNWKNVGAEIII